MALSTHIKSIFLELKYVFTGNNTYLTALFHYVQYTWL